MSTPDRSDLRTFNLNCSLPLLQALLSVGEARGEAIYVVGGTVRDLLMGRKSQDIDIAVAGQAAAWARDIRAELGAGTIIDLSGPEDDVARFVWQGEQLDISSFRGGTATIEEDLKLRDFTVNAIAMELYSLATESPVFIDPTGGLPDLKNKTVRHLTGAFSDDPVRMLRGYRLSAQFGFYLAKATREAVRRHCDMMSGVAVERIGHELELIFESRRTFVTVKLMAEDGLLEQLLPELYLARGVEQPLFHHLDVLDHSFLALKTIEEIIESPADYYADQQALIREYLQPPEVRRCLKWAALLHDLGKPQTREVRPEKGGRVTFYGHDEVGKELFSCYAERSHWSRADTERVGGLIGMHMHPFHLCNVQRKGPLSKRSALKLSQRAGEDLVGLFLLAMSDSLASSGEKKPAFMEEELAELFRLVEKIYTENIRPILEGPPLISGRDLIKHFALKPGPIFSEIIGQLEEAQVEGIVNNRSEALLWVERFLESQRYKGDVDKLQG
jgi:poly(A) polymerase